MTITTPSTLAPQVTATPVCFPVPIPYMRGWSGLGFLGDFNSTGLINQASGAAAGLINASTKGTAANIAAVGASSTIGILTTLGVVGGPVGAVLSGLISVGMAIANLFKGCGETCVQATKYADQAEQLLQQNLQHYLDSPRYRSLQQAAANNAQTIMQALYQACSNPALQAAGQRCISERLVRGGTAPWCNNPGHTGCDWLVRYLDPITNDQQVIPDPQPQQQGGSNSLPGGDFTGTAGGSGGVSFGAFLASPIVLVGVGALMLYALDN